MNIEEFKIKCNKGFCLRQTVKSKQCLKTYKQEMCFRKYNDKQEKDLIKRQDAYTKNKQKAFDKAIDEKWEELKLFITERDKTCRFYQILTEEEKKIIDTKLFGDFKKLDGAHIVARSSCSKMIYDYENVILLFRYVHSCLDNHIDPFTEKNMSKEEVIKYWKRIIGEQLYDELQERSKRKV